MSLSSLRARISSVSSTSKDSSYNGRSATTALTKEMPLSMRETSVGYLNRVDLSLLRLLREFDLKACCI